MLDEQALLACMVYVDLNPIRAGINDTLEESDYTSIAQRIAEFSNQAISSETIEHKPLSLKTTFVTDNPQAEAIPLANFIGDSQSLNGVPYTLSDYFELADWTGRAIRDDKRGYIPQSEPKIIHKLGIASNMWLETVNNFTQHFYTFIGPEEKMNTICESQNKKWLMGIQSCRRLFFKRNSLTV